LAVLLIHGFTGSPPEMRPIGDYLHARGLSVYAPLLPGHGTDPSDLNRRRWQEFAECVATSYVELAAGHQQVAIGGLSMGALLTLQFAAAHPQLPAAVLYSPALRLRNRLNVLLPLIKHMLPTWDKPRSKLVDPEAGARLWSYPVIPTHAGHELIKLQRKVRRDLPRVSCPLLVVHSTGDDQVHPASPREVLDRAGSAVKELVLLHESGHAITVDKEWERVAERTHTFLQAHMRA
jgi:carboxylesterase